MDLTEFHKSYMKGVAESLSVLWRSLAALRNDPQNRRALDLAFRAAHAIKGSSWTMREAPSVFNDEEPDALYAVAANVAEALETYLQSVLASGEAADRDWLIGRLAEIEMAVAEVSVRLDPHDDSAINTSMG